MASYGAETKERKPKLVKIEHAVGHKLGMRVPEGGSDCEKCEYVDGEKCRNKVFQRWHGSSTIPEPIDCYCCDEFEAKKEKSE